MKEKLDGIKLAALEMIEKAETTAQLNDVRVKYLGKSGEISAIMRDMAKVPKDERPQMGKLVNEMRGVVEGALEEKAQILARIEE
ncbi:MAG: phenylalanine--tRNA ligase subunit alpha, partial [Clostridia bacterium]|nr:phenylalanine--tRNA ligase subunit alpha [Clostridia bacterium]